MVSLNGDVRRKVVEAEDDKPVLPRGKAVVGKNVVVLATLIESDLYHRVY